MSSREFTAAMGLSCAEVLIKAGMTPEKVAVSPKGDFHQVAENDTASNRYKNRRLEILIIPDDSDELYRN